MACKGNKDSPPVCKQSAVSYALLETDPMNFAPSPPSVSVSSSAMDDNPVSVAFDADAAPERSPSPDISLPAVLDLCIK